MRSLRFFIDPNIQLVEICFKQRVQILHNRQINFTHISINVYDVQILLRGNFLSVGICIILQEPLVCMFKVCS
jgi:hypothetical protein